MPEPAALVLFGFVAILLLSLRRSGDCEWCGAPCHRHDNRWACPRCRRTYPRKPDGLPDPTNGY